MSRVSLAFTCLLLLPLASARAAGQAPVPPQTPGSITATVTDPDGAQLPAAQVTLTSPTLAKSLKTTAAAAGRFTYPAVPPGDLTILVTAPNFADGHAAATLHPGESLQLPDIVLPVAADTEEISVQPTRHDMAQPDVVAEEHQRLLGFAPNFYVTYNWHAPPLATGQKFTLAWRTAFDPANFAISAAIAGVEQGTNAYSSYGRGPQGYGKRFGASVADYTTGSFIGGAILPTLFHQDPRYFYKSTGSVLSRALYALSTAVICRGDNGRWQPNYSGVLGDIASGAISDLYYPAGNRDGATLIIENGLLNAAEDGVGNLVQQFLFRRISPGLTPPKP